MTLSGSAICTLRNEAIAFSVACDFDWPSTSKASISCLPMRNVGFSAEPGSWYTIDASRARKRRSSLADIAVTSAPSTRTLPEVIDPLRAR